MTAGGITHRRAVSGSVAHMALIVLHPVTGLPSRVTKRQHELLYADHKVIRDESVDGRFVGRLADLAEPPAANRKTAAKTTDTTSPEGD